ncbi:MULTISPECIES: chorismate mutase [unclassified Vibrio]|uniref:chorismate mutase n=1 Tax=unclassified Vibrio TaxID=2614977 RepID=UPI0010A69CDC|nr:MULTISPECIES: chorismate mutase [unclassified Vibrio]WGY46842.1 chorismate mutase [Vibrio sp. ABG19]
MRLTRILIASALLSFNTFAAPAPDQLFSTINQRLSYMEDVALYKANHHRPIEDIEREAVVIDKASDSAQQQGLNKQSIVGFFQAQISAAKAIQYRYRADLLSQNTTAQPRDLNQVIRPELLKLGKQINSEIAHFLLQGGTFSADELPRFKQALTARYLSDSDKEMLFAALAEIKLQ